MNTLAFTGSQKSLTKNFIILNMERKKIGQIQQRISMRRLVCDPKIQKVIIYQYTIYDLSCLQGCGEIFDEKVLWNYGRAELRKDRWKDGRKPVYPPHTFSKRGYKEFVLRCIHQGLCSEKEH